MELGPLASQREMTKTASSLTAASIEDIEEFFLDTAAQYIRRYFPPSFAFTEIEVNDKRRQVKSHNIPPAPPPIPCKEVI